jgi:hypothetical protein
MKVIAFSLWGDDKLYCQGAIDNIECAKEHYPGWKCRFYTARNCPAFNDLVELDCEVIEMPYDCDAIDRTQDDWHMDINNQAMLWRFLALDDPEVEVTIFRDCDSRVGARDARAVQEWLNSGKPMHRMHECKQHWNAQVMGGMWGMRNMYIAGVQQSIAQYLQVYRQIRNEPWIFVDLWWIMDVVWPNFGIEHCMGHGYGHPNPFTVDGPMVGGVENEEWRGTKYV